MKDRMYQLFYIDGRARLKMYTVSGGIAFLFGVVSMALGSEVLESTVGSVMLTLTMLMMWTLVYCWSPTRLRKESLESAQWKHPTRRLALAGGVLVTSVLVGLSTPTVEAAVINKKLKRYADKPSLEEPEVQALTATLNYVSENGLKVNSGLLATVGMKLAISSNLEFHKASELIAHVQSKIREVRLPKQPVQSARNMDVVQSSFKGNNFEGGTVAFDTNEVIDCGLTRCLIIYLGGPVIVRNTTFIDCRFDIGNTEPARAFLAQVTKSNVVNFSHNPELAGPDR